MLFKLSNLNSNLALTLGYLNPALNNSAQFVQRPISAQPGFLFWCPKAFSLIIFCAFLTASCNHQLVDKKNKTEMLFKLSNLNSNHALTLGYLNPALNNFALCSVHVANRPKVISPKVISCIIK